MSKTMHGITTVRLGDEEFELVPTLLAVRNIEARFGGLRGAAQAVHALSVEGVAHIIASGANVTGKAAEALVEKVWMAGVVDVSVQLSPYLAALYNPRGTDEGNAQAGTE
ncbi:hypothetical protein MCB86_16875 [Pseudomonas sp. KSR10]|uniref:hypothetical protein n=1 Tax=Pseudomonas sp. KSR10 TaxID=2916654 RepID=UPI001EF85EC4|nr:hypothetical protein [Pseudomonas sp. KSR10]MCG6541749.1 hypothetical protein [Pseudomonas sp. KSR10]